MSNSDKEIREAVEKAKGLPLEELEAITLDAAKCGDCCKCKANNNNLDIDCSGAAYAAWTEIVRRMKEDAPTKPQSEPEPVSQLTGDMLSFGRTIQFMRDRGHKRCYMCGSSLTGGDDTGS